ncbi:MAG: helix-turn-helix domain-containing protein [Thermaerobacter sp.]|nr:helix-turn-helix domain-containing protein [Thermaerobacter sp.]
MDGPLRTVERTMRLLSELGASLEPLSLAELSRRLGLGKATVRRFLLSLEELGYVGRDARGAYSALPALGRIVAQPAAAVSRQVAGELRELAAETGTGISLGVLRGQEVLYLWREPPGSAAGVVLGEGARLPAHATAIGKILLAQLAPEAVAEIYGDTPPRAFTPRTIVSLPLLLGALQEIRRQGWALSDGELEEGLTAAAVPVYDRAGGLRWALNAASPGHRLAPAAFATDVVPALMRAAGRIGAIES